VRTPASRRAEGSLLRLRVEPRASRDEILGWRNDVLRVRVTAPPVALRVAPSTVRVVRGERRRDKRVRVAGLTDADVRTRLA